MILTKADLIVNKAAVNFSSDNMQLAKLSDEDIKKNKESLFATGKSEAEKLKQRTDIKNIIVADRSGVTGEDDYKYTFDKYI